MKTRLSIFFLFVVLMAVSCKRLSPAGFWTGYEAELITFKESGQGPWGGEREIHWKSDGKTFFHIKEVNAFASENGWELTDSLFVTDSVRNIKVDSDFGNYSFQLLKRNMITDLLPDSSNIYIFKTGWIAVEPGNLSDTEENGFIYIKSDHTQMMLYHEWGE